MKCEYGCNQEAKFQTKSGKWCCSKSPNSCPEVKRKNSEGLKKAYKEGRKNCKHFDKNGLRNWAKGKTVLSDNRIKRKFDSNKIFVINGTVGFNRVRDLIKKENLILYECSICQIKDWINKPITLELDHINGNRNDNRLENLRYLCPNCHSQTNTFRGKNFNGNTKVKEEILVNALNENNSIHSALKSVGLAPKGANYFRVRTLIEKYKIKKFMLL